MPKASFHVLTHRDQVRNTQSTVKIACDFVSVHNLVHMAALRPDQREQRLAGGEAEDVLQLFTLLWYAWLSVTTFKEPTFPHVDKAGEPEFQPPSNLHTLINHCVSHGRHEPTARLHRDCPHLKPTRPVL